MADRVDRGTATRPDDVSTRSAQELVHPEEKGPNEKNGVTAHSSLDEDVASISEFDGPSASSLRNEDNKKPGHSDRAFDY